MTGEVWLRHWRVEFMKQVLPRLRSPVNSCLWRRERDINGDKLFMLVSTIVSESQVQNIL